MLRRVRYFTKDARAVAAIEFALILPLLLLLSVSAYELQRYLRFERQFSMAAETIASMTAQRQDGNGQAPRQDLDAMQHLIPDMADTWYLGIAYQMTHVVFKTTVPDCKADCEYAGDVAWSWPVWTAMGALRRTCGALTKATPGQAPDGKTLPADVFGPGGVIVVDMITEYKPLFGSSFIKPVKLTRQGFANTRFASPYMKINAFSNLLKCDGYP